jgi:hypothetical protein
METIRRAVALQREVARSPFPRMRPSFATSRLRSALTNAPNRAFKLNERAKAITNAIARYAICMNKNAYARIASEDRQVRRGTTSVTARPKNRNYSCGAQKFLPLQVTVEESALIVVFQPKSVRPVHLAEEGGEIHSAVADPEACRTSRRVESEKC